MLIASVGSSFSIFDQNFLRYRGIDAVHDVGHALESGIGPLTLLTHRLEPLASTIETLSAISGEKRLRLASLFTASARVSLGRLISNAEA